MFSHSGEQKKAKEQHKVDSVIPVLPMTLLASKIRGSLTMNE